MTKFVLTLTLLVVVMAATIESKPWIQGVELGLPREVNKEAPVEGHKTECKIFYIYNYPMTCGDELVFSNSKLACVPPEDVADERPECATKA